MGWLFQTGQTKKELIADLIRSPQFGTDGRGDKITFICLAHSTRGNCLWSVWEATNGSQGGRYIRLDLLGVNDHSWGCKSMDESMGPCYYSCPLNYLSMAPVTNQEWRDHVKEHHKNAGRKLRVGKTYKIINSANHVKLTSLKPLRGLVDNCSYRIPRRAIGDEIIGQ